MDHQQLLQQCGRTTVCSSSNNNNNIVINVVPPPSSPSPSPSPSPSSSPSSHSSMEMVLNHSLPPPPPSSSSHHHHNNNNNNNNNVLFAQAHMAAAAARAFGNNNNININNSNDPSPYYFMDGGCNLTNNNNSISVAVPNSTSDPMIISTPPSTNNNTYASAAMSMRAKIMSHPHFPRLLSAYSNCQKVGAPPEVAARLEEVCGAGTAAAGRSGGGGGNGNSSIGEDPALDQFMEAYCEMLTKYEQELSKPFKEAMLFLSRIESQFRALTLNNNSSPNSAGSGDFTGRNNNGSTSEDDIDALEASCYIDPHAEDKELKVQLLRRYSGYLGNLKQEFLKKKKKGKLPKEARQQLLEWWNRHYKWPYPSESQKVALAEATGLDQKQINNWFINQRKRHWKPTEDMQFVVMDAAYPHHYYLENGVAMGSSNNAFPLDFNCSTSHL